MDTTNSVSALIDMFGGLAAMARELGHKNPTTVQGWKIRGSIPVWRQFEILEAAKRLGLPITKRNLDALNRTATNPALNQTGEAA